MSYLGTKPQTATQLADNIVTTEKIAAGAVVEADIADGAVTTNKLANTGVTAGTYGSASVVPVVTVDAKGRLTTVSTASIAASAPTTAQVLAATAGATAGGVGTYAMGCVASQITTSVNGNLAGSSILYASVYPAGNLVVVAFGSMTGTWKSVSGDQSGSYGGYNLASLWLRVA